MSLEGNENASFVEIPERDRAVIGAGKEEFAVWGKGDTYESATGVLSTSNGRSAEKVQITISSFAAAAVQVPSGLIASADM